MHSTATKKRLASITITLFISGCTSLGLANEPPSHCLPNEKIYFSCIINNGKILSLCGENENSTKALSYRYGKKDNLELVFPSSTQQSAKQFKYNNYFRYGTDYYRVSFLSGQYYYRIYRDIDSELTPKVQAGIIVENKADTNRKEFNLSCTDNISDNLNMLSEFLECDPESALGCSN